MYAIHSVGKYRPTYLWVTNSKGKKTQHKDHMLTHDPQQPKQTTTWLVPKFSLGFFHIFEIIISVWTKLLKLDTVRPNTIIRFIG